MFNTVFNDLIFLSVFLLIGVVIREVVKPLQKLFIPASVIGGLIALILGQQVLGFVELPETFSSMPGPMINFVLAAMIFGTTMNKSKVKRYFGTTNMLCMTYFAQLFVGVGAGLILSKIWPSLPKSWGVMSVFCFWGGHGAASSAGALFQELGVEGNLAMGIILATLGLITAIIFGMMLINWGVRKGYAKEVNKNSNDPSFYGGIIPKEKQPSLGKATVSSNGINGLALQIALIMLSMFVGAKLFGFLKEIIPALSNVPSLLYGIVGAGIIWGIMCKTHLDGYANKETINSLSGIALEVCVCSAVATLDIAVVSTYIVPILIFTTIIVSLMAVICVFFGKRYLDMDWFEIVLILFGQGLGSTPTGFALARCVDPETKTTAWEAIGVAVGVFAPISSMLVAILPVIAMKSDFILMGIGIVVFTLNVILGELFLKKKALS
jgi:ESS family glutamate:Na+ symporter